MHKPLIALLILLLAGTATANLNDCELIQINSTHWYFETNQTNLTNGTYNYQAFANNISTEYRILEVDIGGSLPEYTPPTPTSLANTTGNFWINHTWSHGSGNVTDSYNVKVNDVWHNTSPAYYNDTYTAHAWQNITVFAFNSSGIGTLSAANITQDTQIPNNPITITNTSDWSGDAGENVYVDYDATDADSDTPTFSCNRTDLFTDFSTSTSKGNWTATAGTHYVDFGVSDGYGSTSNYTMTIHANITVTLLSQTPSTIYQNTTGTMNISYGISHGSSGLNNTSVSFIFRNYDHTLNDANHSIRPPANNKSVTWNYNGQILRAANRNETLNFEKNDTITGGDTHTFSGLDENQTRLTIVPVNSTYSIVHINGTVNDLAMEQMWYLDRTDLVDAPKTQLAVHKSQDVLIKFWDAEIFKGNYDFIGAGYTDTSLNSAPALQPSDANPVSFYYLNASYDPLGGVDPLDSEYAVYMGSLNATQWVDHVYSPGQNASYVRGLINNTVLHSIINTTEISYLYFKSNTPASKPYYINITDASTITNRTFGQTDVLWIGDTAPYTAHPYTPNVWFAFIYSNTSFDHKLYVADNDGVWGNSTLQSTYIGEGLFDPTTPIIDHFHFNGRVDYDMNHSYSGTIEVRVGVGTDPDGGTVTHNLTLHYANRTFVAIINNTFTDADIIHNGVYADISFNTIPYYSETEEYTLKVVATDDEGATSRSWSCCNFTLSPPYIPPDPVNIANTTGNFWINHTWSPGSGNVTDSYNIIVNDVWHNTTTDTFWNDTYTAHAWQNITVYAFNSSGIGTLSAANISQDTQIPNNDPSAASPSPSNGATGVSTTPTLQVTVTDADSDNMSVRFYDQYGSQIGSTQTNIPSGSTASVVWGGRSPSTTYYWYVITNDSYNEITSSVWHFTTQSGSPPPHYVTIEDCNNRQTTEGGEIYNDFNYTNDDPDVPVFTNNATEGTLNSSTGIYNWTTSVGDAGVYVWWFRADNAYGNYDTCTVTFTVSPYGTPATPTNLAHTKNDTWVNHTWNGGSHTDSFNVSINDTWYNGTTNEYYNNTGLSTDSWSNITVWAYNATNGYLSASSVSENVQIAAAEEEERELPTTIPTSIFIAITVLMMCMTVYTLHTKGYVQKTFGGMITTMMAFMLSQQIVSGNVVHSTTLLKSTDVFVTESVEIIIPELSYVLLFIAVIMSLITMIFFIKYILYLYDMSQKKGE